jgi:hypothetical protein
MTLIYNKILVNSVDFWRSHMALLQYVPVAVIWFLGTLALYM